LLGQDTPPASKLIEDTRRVIMETGVEREDTVAFVLIKAELGQALNVATEVSTLNWEEEDRDGVTIKGVRWAVVVTGPYDVIAAVKVRGNRELGDLVIEQIQNVEGVKNPSTVVVSSYYKNGEVQPLGHNGPP
jgi:DNA-binding Lrp family transcriptional regulator